MSVMNTLIESMEAERNAERNGGSTPRVEAPVRLGAPVRLDATARPESPAMRSLKTPSKPAALATVLTTPLNDDIFTPKFGPAPYDYAPRMIYFYYISVNEHGSLRVSHYEYHEDDPAHPNDSILKWKEIPRNKPDLETICYKLAMNARLNGPGLTGSNFRRVRWSRVSYIMAFFDEPFWNLYRKPSDGSCVVFLTKKGSIDYIPNHSFYDAVDLEVPFSATDIRSGIAFINHLKRDEAGTTLGEGGIKETQDFQFNVFVNVNFEDGSSSPMNIILDPGGTNQGPPETP